MNEPLLRVDGLVKRFGGLIATSDSDARRPAARAARRHRPERRRQDDAGVADCRRIEPGFRDDPFRRRGDQRPFGAGAHQARPGAHVPDHAIARTTIPRSTTSRSPSRRARGTVFASGRTRARTGAAQRSPPISSTASGFATAPKLRSARLSHGEQKQLELAIALATGPRLLLLDEPMAGLGAAESAQMIDLLRELKGEVAILLIEHDMDAVFVLADRVSVLVNGQCIATGTSEPSAAMPRYAPPISARATC